MRSSGTSGRGWAAAAAALFLGAAPVQALTPAEETQGFVSIFDGKTLDGWVGSTEGYAVEDGAIYCIPQKGGNLYSAKEYRDFILRFEFKLTPNANNGLGIRAPRAGDAAYQGLELQILDNDGPAYKSIQPWQTHGSVYGIAAAKRGALKPVGEWNEQEVVVHGRKVWVILNGQTIVLADLDEASTPKTLDGKNHPGLLRAQGHLAFLGHGHRVDARNLRIKEINPAQSEK